MPTKAKTAINAIVVAGAFALGGVGGTSTLLCWQNWYPYPSFPITPRDIDAVAIQENVPPMWAILHFASEAEFKSGDPTPHKTALAYTFSGPINCQITLPAGIGLVFYPHMSGIGSGNFVDREVGDTIAHELAHCLHGAWHNRQ